MFLKERIVRKEKTAQFRGEAKRGRKPLMTQRFPLLGLPRG